MQKIEGHIATLCRDQLPCFPPNSDIKIGSVLVLRKTGFVPAKKNASVQWFDVTDYNLADILRLRFNGTYRDLKEANPDIMPVILDSNGVAVQKREFTGAAKAHLSAAFNMGAGGGSKNFESVAFNMGKITRTMASDEFRHVLGNYHDMNKNLRSQDLKRLIDDDGGVIAVVHKVFEATMAYQAVEGRSTTASILASLKSPIEQAGGDAKLSGSKESGLFQANKFPKGAVAFGIFLYRATTFDGDLYMGKCQEVLNRSQHYKLGAAVDWNKNGPFSKLSRREQLIQLKDMTKCGHYIVSQSTGTTIAEAESEGRTEAAKQIGLQAHMIEDTGFAFRMQRTTGTEPPAELAELRSEAAIALRRRLAAPDPPGALDEESSDDDMEDNEPSLVSSVIIIKKKYNKTRISELYSEWKEGAENGLSLGDGWVLQEMKVCLFFDVNKLKLRPVTLKTGAAAQKAPGCVFRYLDNGAFLITPIGGGPENVPGSAQRVFGNGDCEDWHIKVSTEFVSKNDRGKQLSLANDGYYLVNRSQDDIDFKCKPDCLKMMSYTLEESVFSGKPGEADKEALLDAGASEFNDCMEQMKKKKQKLIPHSR